MSTERIRIRTNSTGTRALSDDRTIARPAGDTVHSLHSPAAAYDGTRPRLYWSTIWAGLLGALVALFMLSLLGAAVGLTGLNAATAAAQGAPPADAGRNSAIWAAISAILAFLIGGYLASRLANMTHRNWGAINGAMVFLLGLPILLWLAGQGLGAVLGTFSNIGASLSVPAGQAADAAGQAGAAARTNPTAVGDAAAALRNAAWATLLAALLGLGASAVGGMLGAHVPSFRPRQPRPEERPMVTTGREV